MFVRSRALYWVLDLVCVTLLNRFCLIKNQLFLDIRENEKMCFDEIIFLFIRRKIFITLIVHIQLGNDHQIEHEINRHFV